MELRRQPKEFEQLLRKEPFRTIRERILIVCEGEESEPCYINGLIDHYHLTSADVKVVPNGSDPRNLVDEAERLYNEYMRKGIAEKFDVVFCVFDRDEHHHFDNSSEKANRLKFKLARSWPCFEFWLLLHYEFSRHPFMDTGDCTASKNCENQLKKLMKKTHDIDYRKNMPELFSLLKQFIEKAEKNAKSARLDAQDVGDNNPSTEFHLLVDYLRSLASKTVEAKAKETEEMLN